VTDLSSDPMVKRLIELHTRIELLAKDGSVIKGWHPLRLNSNGMVVAGKIVNGAYLVKEFKPVTEWKNAVEYLALQNEFRSLLFSSDLTTPQFDAYRNGIGLSVARSKTVQRKGKERKKESEEERQTSDRRTSKDR
jgi:hypothetical protein